MPRDLEKKRETQRRYYSNNREDLLRRQRASNSTKRRPRQLQRLYGISIEDYNNLFESQKGCCAICGEHQANLKTSLSVDHNHITGEVRGLLCKPCNMAIGIFKDDIQIAIAAVDYLKRTTNG